MSERPPAQYLPPLLAALTAVGGLLALLGTAAWQRVLPAAFWHLAFAVGALPLVLAAMTYFVPVLTRTPAAPRLLALAPLAAGMAGIAIVAWFLEGNEALRLAAPWVALAAVAGLGAWMARRRSTSLGRPHGCLGWYGAALGFLALGLAAVGVSPFLPDHAEALRRLHLHANTLGFLGLAAVGTLQVLLPTVLGYADETVPRRLRRDLPWSVGGTLAILAGAAWWAPAAIVGAVCYALPLLRLLADLIRRRGRALWAPKQPAPLLLAAVAGLLGVLVQGVVHAAEPGFARPVLPQFVIGFLLPLISGAVGQLLPVWWRPGVQDDWHRNARWRLAGFARTRALLLCCGGMLAATGNMAGQALGALGAAWLLAAMTVAISVR